MKISIVIITRNRMVDVKASILGYLRQTYQDKEIIVIDNASADGTREMMASEFPDIQYLWLPDNFDIRSINLGVQLSKGDIIWRTDSDSYPESPDAFEKVIDIFEKHPSIDIIATDDIEVRQGSTLHGTGTRCRLTGKTHRMTVTRQIFSQAQALPSKGRYSIKSAVSGSSASRNWIFAQGLLLPASAYAISPT